MAFTNYYQVTKEINGITYTAQFNGLSFRDETLDSCHTDDGNVSFEKLATALFDKVLVEPKAKIDDFGADKIGKTKEKIINGTKYVAKFNGVKAALRAMDNCYIDGTSNTSIKKLREYLFENVITVPEKLEVDSFETAEELDEVTTFAREAMQDKEAMNEFNAVLTFLRETMEGKLGNFRTENTGTTKKTGKR